MKISISIRAPFAGFAAFVACAATLGASPLPAITAIQTRPEPNAPAIQILKAGTEPEAAADQEGVPAGWLAVPAPGPFEAYVRNRDLNKQLDVRPGSSLRLAPGDDAGVLELFQKGDKATITGLHGSWTRLRLDKTLTGYIRLGAPAASPAPAPASAPAPVAALPAPAPPPAAPDTGAAPLYFDGTFASTRLPLLARRPYDWELKGANGGRRIYLDMSRVTLTDQLENFTGHPVEVFGRASIVGNGPDIVVQVETLRLQ